MNHYHIRWANSKIDWQAFQTKDEAVAEAERLKRPDENYSIEEREGNCERCKWLNPNTRIAKTGGVNGSESRRSRNRVQNQTVPKRSAS
jgi:hypothetical protein